MAKQKQTKKVAAADANAAASAEIEEKCSEVMKRAVARVAYFDAAIKKHEAHIVAAKAKQEKVVANAEKRCNNLRLKGDPRTKLQAQIAKLEAKQAKLMADLAAMK